MKNLSKILSKKYLSWLTVIIAPLKLSNFSSKMFTVCISKSFVGSSKIKQL